MATVDLLQHIGLNKYEAEAYYALLTHGQLTGYEVGKYSQVPGSRSYEILERLLEKGLALVQPGEPPRYSAQDPQAVFERFRSTMETTLNTLATSLASLAHVDRMGEFWVVRGKQNILVQARAMIANARETLDLKFPAGGDVAESLSQANERGCRVFRVMTEERDGSSILLVRDGCEALVGMLTPPDSCQAVVSSNAALLDALRSYFQYRRLPGRVASEVSAKASRDFDCLIPSLMNLNDHSRSCHPFAPPVILSAAKDLGARRGRPFAALRVTIQNRWWVGKFIRK